MPALVDNIVHFARLLREGGITVTPTSIETAVRAVGFAGVEDRNAFRAALFASLVTRAGQRELFDQLFVSFWKDPQLLEKSLALLLPQIAVPAPPTSQAAGARRANDLLGSDKAQGEVEIPSRVEVDATETTSSFELLRQKDFEQMSLAEASEARRVLAARLWSLPERKSRRMTPSTHAGQPDLRRTMRKALRTGGNVSGILQRRPRTIEAPLVILCDISGSMSMYARMCLHMFHGLTTDRRIRRARTHTFVFGTRLTNITRALTHRDTDVALAEVSRLAQDWDGGTRIGDALHAFNFDWGRRVLGQGATVLLVTDGLERESLDLLDAETARLCRTARRVIWLNPLLRYDAFAPKAQGIRILLRHVHELRPVHNLATLMDLASVLQARGKPDELARIRKRVA
jgi:uncharacterized protein with von Willebrand factor type A (vWA) domain